MQKIILEHVKFSSSQCQKEDEILKSQIFFLQPPDVVVGYKIWHINVAKFYHKVEYNHEHVHAVELFIGPHV